MNSGKPSHKGITYTEHTAHTWEDIQSLYGNYSSPSTEDVYWIFRAEEPNGVLQTKLEIAFDRYGIEKENRRHYEKCIIREFQRKASLYIEHEPDKNDILEWLAIMRHHGAPVRLIDWTYSFYIAVYFALAEKTSGEVWAFNAATVNKPEETIAKIRENDKGNKLMECRQELESKDDLLKIRSAGDKLDDLAISTYIMHPEAKPVPLVYAVNPFRLNKRLTIQQGLFLIVGDIEKKFIDNLKACFKDGRQLEKNVHRIKLDVKKERNKIIRELKNMNISNEVLFPDLDGFARSLAEQLAYPETFPANEMKDRKD